MLYNGNLANVGPNAGAAVWASGTYKAGMAPCLLTVSGTHGGFITVNDATGMLLFQQPQTGKLSSGQQLQQVRLSQLPLTSLVHTMRIQQQHAHADPQDDGMLAKVAISPSAQKCGFLTGLDQSPLDVHISCDSWLFSIRQAALQGRELFSTDNSVFLLVQQDGNLVLCAPSLADSAPCFLTCDSQALKQTQATRLASRVLPGECAKGTNQPVGT